MKKRLLAVFGGMVVMAVSGLALGEELALERIAALPSLIGTAPTGPVWSRDGRTLAFLWNDAGMPHRDVWLVDGDADVPTQLTQTGNGGVSGAVWMPDGSAVVYAARGGLFRVSRDAGEPEQIAAATGAHALAFSPDGKFLSYLEAGDLHLWNRDNGTLVQATRVGVPAISRVPGASFDAPDVAFMSYRWSPDSRHVALNFEDRRQVRKMLFPNYLGEETRANVLRRDLPGENDLIRSLSVYSVDSGALRSIELPGATDRRFGSYRFSPNARSLLVDQFSEDGEHRWIYNVDAETRAVRELRHDYKPKGGSTTSASSLWTSDWKSNGDGIVLLSDVDGWFHLYELPLDGGAAKALTSGEWSIVGAGFEGAGLTVSPETRELFFVASKKSPYERQVYRLSEDGGSLTQLTSLPGTHRPFVSPDGRRVATIHSSDSSPPELYIVDTQGGSERRVTHSPPEEFSQHAWIEPRYVTFKSRADGATLHGRLLEPPNRDPLKRYPAILGPVYSNTVRNRWVNAFDTYQQYLALEAGYYVLLVDIRGSVSYGREFRSQFVEAVGTTDIEDLHSGVEYLETLSSVDNDRIGIWGWSYGGLLTAMSLFKKPGVYQAGVAGAPATNVWHATTGEVDLFYHPNARPDLYQQGSAVNFAEGLADPFMIIHGMQDSIVLFKDTVTLAEKLIELGKDFELVPLPSSVHDPRRQVHVATHVLKKVTQHFDRYLGRGPR